MKHLCIAFVISALVIIPTFSVFAAGGDETKGIMVEIGDGSAAGDAYLKATPLAKGGGTSTHTADKRLISVVTCDYLVDKDVKSIQANYIIYTGDSPAPIRRSVILPIQLATKNPIKTHVDGNFSAFAVMTK